MKSKSPGPTPGTSDPVPKEHPENGFGRQRERRARILICACDTLEAGTAVNFGTDVETIYLPSFDLEEVREEVERLNPNYVICGADFLLDFYPAQAEMVSAHKSTHQNGSAATAQIVPSSLSRRDIKVLTMLAKGLTNEEIARSLHLGLSTVKRILRVLFEQLEVTNRTELTWRATELHILEEDS